MGELRSAIDGLRSEVLAELPDALAEEAFAEIRRGIEALQAEELRRLADLERRGVHERDGYLSAASWLASVHRLSPGVARRKLRTARGVEHMPATRAALDAGEVSIAAVELLAQARGAYPQAFAESEPLLVHTARLHSVPGLARVLGHWSEAAAAHAEAETEDQRSARRYLHASATGWGMVRVDGELDPVSGEALLTALGAVCDAEARSAEEDERSPAQRRADALGEVCRQWLDHSPRPEVAGERPHLTTLTVGAELLAAGLGHPIEGLREDLGNRPGEVPGDAADARSPRAPELDHVGPVPLPIARRLSCDTSVMRVVMGGRSEPLEVGRRTPVVSSAIRRALVCRDRNCRFPGCDRPHAWCDAHHVVHWADGGRTGLSNLVLLCRRHHRLVHRRGGFSLELTDRGPVVRRPDGSVLQGRGPPPL